MHETYTDDYEMYTAEGNAAVHALVQVARRENWTWTATEKALFWLSKVEAFAEASDTAVREAVWMSHWDRVKL